jgi:hypothetical protein
MSRPAAATQQKPEPRIRRARFAEEDLVSTFGETTLAEARRLLGAGAVDGVPSVAEWRQRPEWSPAKDDDMRRHFVTTILPKLVAVRPSDISRTLGVTPNHAIKIRLGRTVPHPRFHGKLATLLS